MGITISVSLQKGGVGKSTTSQALASTLGLKKKKVLLIDTDPQGNVSFASGITGVKYTSYEVLLGKCEVEQAIYKTKYYDIIPADERLSDALLELKPEDNAILKDKLEHIKDNYDMIIIDTPPALSITNINALMCSDYVIIPCEPRPFALQGLSALNDTIKAVHGVNKNLKVLGILLIKYSNRTVLNRQIKDMIDGYAKQMNTKVFQTSIREGIAVGEAQAMQEPLIDYAKDSKPSIDYKAFTTELLKELK